MDARAADDRYTVDRYFALAEEGLLAPDDRVELLDGVIVEYWIVNLREYTVEWFSDPEPETRVYRSRGKAFGRDRLPLSAFPDVEILAEAMIPNAARRY